MQWKSDRWRYSIESGMARFKSCKKPPDERRKKSIIGTENASKKASDHMVKTK